MDKAGKTIIGIISLVLVLFALASGVGIDLGKVFVDLLNPIEKILIEDEKVVIVDKDLSELFESIEVIDTLPSIEYNRDDWEKPRKTFSSKYENKNISIRDYSLEIYAKAYFTNGDFDYLIDPYTNKPVEDKSSIDYDHIIPLSYVAKATEGREDWTSYKKNQYAFDLDVGVPTSARENRSKGAKGPSKWLPEENIEEYVYTWLVIADSYKIPLHKDDINTIKRILKDASSEDLQVINIYED